MEDNEDETPKTSPKTATRSGSSGRVRFDDNVTEVVSLDIPPDVDGESGEYDNELSSRDFPPESNPNHEDDTTPGASDYGGVDYPLTSTRVQVEEDERGEEEEEEYRRKSLSVPAYRRPRPHSVEAAMVNLEVRDKDQPDGKTAREMVEMKRLDRTSVGDKGYESRLSAGDFRAGSLRHRRVKSQYQNGFDFYRQRHRRPGSFPHPDQGGEGEGDGDGAESQESDSGGHHLRDMALTMQFLSTLKVQRKSRKKRGSSKKEGGEAAKDGAEQGEPADGEDGDADDGDDISVEEEVGLPSSRNKLKGLSERVRMISQTVTAAEVARQQNARRDTFWEVSPNLVKVKKKRSSLKQRFKYLKELASSFYYSFKFWTPHFKEIEGQCGIATTTYFRFTRWLVNLNLMIFLIFLFLLYIPQFVVWAQPSKNFFLEPTNLSVSEHGLQESLVCTQNYIQYLNNISDYTGIPVILDFVKGTGLLEGTHIFYGLYTNLSLTYVTTTPHGQKLTTDFNVSLAYLLVMMGTFLIIYIRIVVSSSLSVRETIMDLENRAIPSYTNAVFSGWDYCIASEKMAFFKQKIIFNIFQAKLEEMEIKRQQQLQTRKQKIRLWVKRGFINVLVLCILASCFYCIVSVTSLLIETQEDDMGEVLSLLIEFLPSIVISILNFIIPIIFLVLVEKEEYSASRSTSLTIIRAVFLRISLVGVLLFSLYYRLFIKQNRDEYFCPEEGLSKVTTICCGNQLWKTGGENGKGSVKCWETYVGQQFYKLSVADFFNNCVILFGFAFLRKVLWFNFKDRVWFVYQLGLQHFDLPLEVLDIIYTQTLCWVGMFFSPLLPFFCLIQTFTYFFVKKYILLQLCEPPKNTYRASNSYSFFQVVLLVTFTMICVMLGYMIRNIQPSKGCGPFRVYSSSDHVMFDAITNEVNSWPDLPKGIFQFFGTMGFFIPAFLILAMGIYYYWAVAQGYKRLETLLQHQLKSESYDKQYLLARVDEVIKKGQLTMNEDSW